MLLDAVTCAVIYQILLREYSRYLEFYMALQRVYPDDTHLHTQVYSLLLLPLYNATQRFLKYNQDRRFCELDEELLKRERPPRPIPVPQFSTTPVPFASGLGIEPTEQFGEFGSHSL